MMNLAVLPSLGTTIESILGTQKNRIGFERHLSEMAREKEMF
jgi:hypothetical protein